jgi:hypothetical protein
MISAKHRALFVHIPKCGGQSLESFFLRALGLTWEQRDQLLLRRNHDPSKGPPRLAHMTAAEYVSLGYVGAAEFQRYYKFAFVRNPWARLVSEYRYRPFHVYRYDFRTFVLRHFPKPGWSDAYRHVMPQVEYLTDGDGRLLVDFVGKLENMSAGFATVCAALGFPPSQLPRTNVTRVEGGGLMSHYMRYRLQGALRGHFRVVEYRDYRDYYDDETREHVAHYYRDDIKSLGYGFDPPGSVGGPITLQARAEAGPPLPVPLGSPA